MQDKKLDYEMLLGKFLEEYEYKLSYNARRSYKTSINMFFKETKLPVKKVTKFDIELWLAEKKNKGRSEATIWGYLFGLRFFFSRCCEESITETNPTLFIKVASPPERIPPFLDLEEIYKLFDMSKDNPKYRVIMHVLFFTGIRPSELIKIKLSDINWDLGSIKVKGKRKKERTVFFTPKCREVIKDYLANRESDNPYLIITKYNKPYNRARFSVKINEYGKKLGIAKQTDCYIFRHSFAYYMLEKGAEISDVADLLGHDDTDLTEKFYANISLGNIQKVHDKHF